MQQTIEKLQTALTDLISKTGPIVSVALVAETFLKGTAAVVLTLQRFGFVAGDLLRVQAVQATDDPAGAAIAIRAHRGPVVIEIARGMPIKVMNQLLDNEILVRDKRAVLLVFEAGDWQRDEEFFGILAKVGYAVIRADTLQ